MGTEGGSIDGLDPEGPGRLGGGMLPGGVEGGIIEAEIDWAGDGAP